MHKLDKVAVARRPTDQTRSQYIASLKAKRYRLIGSGAFSNVFINPTKEHVIKVGTRRDNHSYLDFVAFTLANQSNVWLPTIFDAGVYSVKGRGADNDSYFAVAMEVLKPISQRGFDSVSDPLERPADFVRLQKSGLVSFNDQSFVHVLNMLNKLSRKGHELDLHSGNVMLRGKQAVVTDPVVD